MIKELRYCDYPILTNNIRRNRLYLNPLKKNVPGNISNDAIYHNNLTFREIPTLKIPKVSVNKIEPRRTTRIIPKPVRYK